MSVPGSPTAANAKLVNISVYILNYIENILALLIIPNIYIYIYIYIYICVCVHVCVCIYILIMIKCVNWVLFTYMYLYEHHLII